jgi:hypothetical protein
MRTFGSTVRLPAVDQATGLRSWNDRRYGITDIAVASRYGYRLGSREPRGRDSGFRVSPVEAGLMSGRGPAVVHGKRVPDGGCSGRAGRLLDAGTPPGTDPSLAQRLSMASFAASRQDPAVLEAVRRWSDCMRTRGLSYAGPLDPPADPRFRGAVGPIEIKVARSDIACKAATNLVGVWFTVEAMWQRHAIAANLVALDLLRRANAGQLAVAASAGA